MTEDKAGLQVRHIQLLTHQHAEERREMIISQLDEQQVNNRLADEFGLDEAFLAQTGLSLDDKWAMLRAHEEIQQLEVDVTKLIDDPALAILRQKVARAMMPASSFVGLLQSNRLERVTEKYREALRLKVSQYGLDRQGTKDLVKSEQLLRLSTLNEVMDKRRRSARVGFIAMSGAMMAFTMGSGGGIGEMVALSDPAIPPALSVPAGALLIGALGVWIIRQERAEVRKQSRYVQDFRHLERDQRETTLTKQLKAEAKLARDNLYYARPSFNKGG